MNRAGYLVVYLSWGYGVGVLVWSVVARRRPGATPSRPAPIARGFVIVGAGVIVGSFFGPWIEWSDGTGHVVFTETAWAGLDPLSTGTITLLCAAEVAYLLRPAAGGSSRGTILLSQGACIAGLLVGNLVIQATTTRGSELGPAAGVAVAGLGLGCLGGLGVARAGRGNPMSAGGV